MSGSSPGFVAWTVMPTGVPLAENSTTLLAVGSASVGGEGSAFWTWIENEVDEVSTLSSAWTVMG